MVRLIWFGTHHLVDHIQLGINRILVLLLSALLLLEFEVLKKSVFISLSGSRSRLIFIVNRIAIFDITESPILFTSKLFPIWRYLLIQISFWAKLFQQVTFRRVWAINYAIFCRFAVFLLLSVANTLLIGLSSELFALGKLVNNPIQRLFVPNHVFWYFVNKFVLISGYIIFKFCKRLICWCFDINWYTIV